MRTAKSCGPDAAVLASNRAGSFLRGDGGKRAVHRGEHEVSRKATAQGRPGCSACTCMLVCAFFVRNCTRDRGCSVHPVFPAPSVFEGGTSRCKPRANRVARSRAYIYPRRPGQAKRELRCAIAHRGTHNHQCLLLHRTGATSPSTSNICGYGSRRSPGRRMESLPTRHQPQNAVYPPSITKQSAV